MLSGPHLVLALIGGNDGLLLSLAVLAQPRLQMALQFRAKGRRRDAVPT
jgi:hypothetical protein